MHPLYYMADAWPVWTWDLHSPQLYRFWLDQPIMSGKHILLESATAHLSMKVKSSQVKSMTHQGSD